MAKEKSSTLAKWAFGLSLAAAIFSGFQWWDSQRQNRINAAIELSKIYLTTGDLRQGYALLLDTEPVEAKGNYGSFLRARHYLDFLEYIAYLANHSRIDNDYVSARIKCDIANINLNFIPKNPNYSRDNQEIVIYVREGKHADCPDNAPASK